MELYDRSRTLQVLFCVISACHIWHAHHSLTLPTRRLWSLAPSKPPVVVAQSTGSWSGNTRSGLLWRHHRSIHRGPSRQLDSGLFRCRKLAQRSACFPCSASPSVSCSLRIRIVHEYSRSANMTTIIKRDYNGPRIYFRFSL